MCFDSIIGYRYREPIMSPSVSFRATLAKERRDAILSRRGMLLGAGIAGMAAVASCPSQTQAASPPPSADHTIRIAPVSLEIAPGKIIKTTAYNGTVPGPPLRLQESKPVAINVINDSG